MITARGLLPAAVLSALLLAACGAPIPLWTPDYAQQQTTRTYADVPPAKALAAAEEVVRLAGDPRDVQVTPTATGAVAHRYYVGFVGMQNVSNDYAFALQVAPAGQGSTVALTLTASRSDFSEDEVIGTSPFLDNGPIRIADPYKLFFARLDYLLGKRADWVTCAAAPAALGASVALDPLCYRARDGAPPTKG